jgi:alpha-mannosidase
MPYFDAQTRTMLNATLEKIRGRVHQPVAGLAVTAYRTAEPVSFAQRLSGEKRDLVEGQSWGALWDCAWFHFTGAVPTAARGRAVDLLIDVSGEACVVDARGEPVRGLTTWASEFDYTLGRPGKTAHPVAEQSSGDETIDLWADCGCNDLFGKYVDSGTLKCAKIAVRNPQMTGLFYDFEVLLELLDYVPAARARHRSILCALRDAASLLRDYTEEEAAQARAVLAPELAKRGGDPSLRISAIGHAHIDLGWLWPIRETIRKGARTFSTVLANMERYPDYRFGASQAQLYQWMKERYPGLYARVKRRVEDGRWEVQGGMWVEADTNLSSGEALVRQFLYGKRFFRQELGKDMRVLWLPDVFGYSGALPQIMRQCGVPYFMTIKLSWNIFNRIPHHSFTWAGIDGSSVIAHMPPEGTYNSSAAPRAVARTESEFLDKGASDRCLLVFGIGDGGGGPGEEHLERLAREKNLDGLAPVTQEPAIEFFDALARDSAKLPSWRGELYFERHQGTYTSQARNKKANRKIELALRETEIASSWAAIVAGAVYPREELLSIWREMLLYQFHDILPGSSIGRVYKESLERYAELTRQVEALGVKARAALLGAGTSQFVWNPLSWARNEWVRGRDGWTRAAAPALGWAAVGPVAARASSAAPAAFPADLAHGADFLQNDLLRLRFDSSGALVSVREKGSDREVLAPGAVANELSVFEDSGDAWDLAVDYRDKPARRFLLSETTTTQDGPRVVRRSVYQIGSSRLEQQVILTAGSSRVDFVTTVDWQERNRMLRTAFPVDVQTDRATYEIQFGSIERPNFVNTTWDMARFEVCAQKWVDLSQGDRGVAVLNDCKYGYRVQGNTIDVDLLRGPCYPDPTADIGTHQFTYSLLPHAGDHREGGVIRAAAELNSPLVVTEGKACPEKSLVSVEPVDRAARHSVIVEAVKLAEDTDDLVLRLYESEGRGMSVRVKAGFSLQGAQTANMLEEPSGELAIAGDAIALSFRPFEIKTVILRPAKRT